jgi:hypothetical protein
MYPDDGRLAHVNLLPSPPHGSAPGFAQICPAIAAALREVAAAAWVSP